tara:strand:- start:767 stop:1030 length:264 start_codon:yes stop_codon:yes gene_type:complete
MKGKKMAAKNECKMECHKVCPCGWLNKRIFGLTLLVWLLLFAVLPHSARGVSWTARSISNLWDDGARVVGVERPNRGERPERRKKAE